MFSVRPFAIRAQAPVMAARVASAGVAPRAATVAVRPSITIVISQRVLPIRMVERTMYPTSAAKTRTVRRPASRLRFIPPSGWAASGR